MRKIIIHLNVVVGALCHMCGLLCDIIITKHLCDISFIARFDPCRNTGWVGLRITLVFANVRSCCSRLSEMFSGYSRLNVASF